ncbi:class I SAM-dependent methyltransferase [Pseudonocardiaceae bacterium YIM PH 21723]|nr:class I SAM-dependent methyltransferase [Pseudonocardiaceae bacterium YIM PH 21723]
MADEAYHHPRLAALYDPLTPVREDLDVYVAMVHELGARRVLDIGCGTGTVALMLADRGIEVTGVDPAAASLDIARAKPGAERVRWIHGTDLPAIDADLAIMTGNVAQAIADEHQWSRTLRGAATALRPGGHLVLETRVPAREAWREWNREATHAVQHVEGVGVVEDWLDVIDVSPPLVTFRWTCVFGSDGQTLVSDSTLRFRERDEVEADLIAHGYRIVEVREAPDRPGREYVFVSAT